MANLKFTSFLKVDQVRLLHFWGPITVGEGRSVFEGPVPDTAEALVSMGEGDGGLKLL